MAGIQENDFIKAIDNDAFDFAQKAILEENLEGYYEGFDRAIKPFSNLSNAKKKVHLTKWKITENLERYLNDFETNATSQGSKVLWANDSAEVLSELDRLIDALGIENIVHQHNALSDELGIVDHFASKKIDFIETNIEYRACVDKNQRPTHVKHPAMHLAVDGLIAQTEESDTYDSLTNKLDNFIKKTHSDLKTKIADGDLVISVADFLIADTGSVVFTGFDGAKRAATSSGKVNVILAGIDQLLPSLSDLDLFLPIASSHDHGQPHFSEVTVMNGGNEPSETGIQTNFIILIDNGRTSVLADKELRQSLYWMQCGASSNRCQIYKTIGGNAYQNPYPGPLGAALYPTLIQEEQNLGYLYQLVKFDRQHQLPNPANLDINHLLLSQKRKAISQQPNSGQDADLWKWYIRLSKSRKWLDFFGPGIKNFLLKWKLKAAWGNRRQFPKIVQKSFSAQWSSGAKDAE